MTRPPDFNLLVEPSDHHDESRVTQAKIHLLDQGFSDLAASAIADFALMEGMLPFRLSDDRTFLTADGLVRSLQFESTDASDDETDGAHQRLIRRSVAELLRQHCGRRWREPFRRMAFTCIEEVQSGMHVAQALLTEPDDVAWALREVMDLSKQPGLPDLPSLPSGLELLDHVESIQSVQDATFWAILYGHKFPVVALEQFRNLPNEDIHAAIRFLYCAFIRRHAEASFSKLFRSGTHETSADASEYGAVDNSVFQPYFEEVTARLDASDGRGMGLSLAWIMLFRIVHRDELPASLDDSDRQRLLAASRAHMAKLRGIIRRLSEDEADDFTGLVEDGFDTERGKVLAPVTLLFASGNLWEATKALLQLIRVSPMPVVGEALEFNDGRHLSEVTIDPWHLIGFELFRGLQNGFRDEQDRDPDLIVFRTSLCRYCLDRLRSKDRHGKNGSATGDDLLEPDPWWRYGYLRAAQELHINPESRGHHVLYWLMQNDPEERIRESAEIAYKRMSNHAALPKGMSPRRAVLASLWWIRQVHRLSLGFEVDAQAAQRTRDREVRMTQSPKG